MGPHRWHPDELHADQWMGEMIGRLQILPEMAMRPSWELGTQPEKHIPVTGPHLRKIVHS
jgi:hypothetical protein